MTLKYVIVCCLMAFAIGCKKEPASESKSSSNPPGDGTTLPSGQSQAAATKIAADVKLTTIDLTPYGLRALIDVPEGAKVESTSFYDWFEIRSGDNFLIGIGDRYSYGKDDAMKEFREKGTDRGKIKEILVDESDVVLFVVGNGEFYAQRWVRIAGELLNITQKDCWDRDAANLMLASAKTFRETVEQKKANKIQEEAWKAFKEAGGSLSRYNGHLRAYCAGPEITKVALDLLRDLPITSIEIENAINIAPDDLQILSHFPSLKKIRLYGKNVTDETLIQLEKFPNLEEVSLVNTSTSNLGYRSLARLKNLKKLTAGWYTMEQPEKSIGSLAGMDGLIELELRGKFVTDEMIQNLGLMKKLKTLNLCETSITDNGIAYLAGHEELEELDLRYTPITDASLRSLKGLKKLQTLKLTKTKVTNAGIQSLSGLSNLKSLHTDGTSVTQKGVDELKKSIPLLFVFIDK